MKVGGQVGSGAREWARRVVAAALMLACVRAPGLAAEPAAEPAATSQLTGRLFGRDGAPAAGATVLAYHLSSEQVFRTEPTDTKGNFVLNKLPYGYFDVAVETRDGLYVADAVVNVPPGGKTSVTLSLEPGAGNGSLRSFPGTEQQPVGLALVDRKRDGGSFWGSAAGIGILAGAGAVALIALASGGGDDGGVASPVEP